MKKNTAGQVIGAQMVSASDGSAFTGAVTVHVTGDGGTQALGSVGSGACTHEGNGFHSYTPAQAETNYSHVAFTFRGTGAVPVTVQVYTTYPQTGDAYSRLGGGSVTALSPVSSDGKKVEIVAGYDYAAADGYALDWSAAHWPDLTGAVVKLFIAQATGCAASVTGSVVSPGEPTQTVRFEPDATATAALDAGHHEYVIEAELGSGRKIPLALGVAHVLRDVR